VPENTPAGSYTIVYQICDKLNPTNCDTATVTVNVAALLLMLQTILSANGTTGDDDAGNVLANGNGTDTLNGVRLP
jgi:hypothetical protein